jgi:citrate/tricarballylate utilization protein
MLPADLTRLLPADLIREGQRVMTVCNACRYCEGYCPVFQAIEHRVTFAKGDLAYLANLCHDCGECLYACQYGPPHEFGINVPKTLGEIRLASYEEYCWPRFLSAAFRRQRLLTLLSLGTGLATIVLTVGIPPGRSLAGNFYQVVPHHVMVTLFTIVSIAVLTALGIGRARFSKKGSGGVFAGRSPKTPPDPFFEALRDALTLRHLHGNGIDCTHAEEARTPWRRWFHHFTFYGFALCFASTTVAALYHLVFGWRAPYGLTSLPVVLGTAGGLGLLIGPSGLLVCRQSHDAARDARGESQLDVSFIALLFLTSLTGLLLLALRDGPAMGTLLVVHLGLVLALFLTLPYGKFVHGMYRAAALVQYARERSAWTR